MLFRMLIRYILYISGIYFYIFIFKIFNGKLELTLDRESLMLIDLTISIMYFIFWFIWITKRREWNNRKHTLININKHWLQVINTEQEYICLSNNDYRECIIKYFESVIKSVFGLICVSNKKLIICSMYVFRLWFFQKFLSTPTI